MADGDKHAIHSKGGQIIGDGTARIVETFQMPATFQGMLLFFAAVNNLTSIVKQSDLIAVHVQTNGPGNLNIVAENLSTSGGAAVAWTFTDQGGGSGVLEARCDHAADERAGGYFLGFGFKEDLSG